MLVAEQKTVYASRMLPQRNRPAHPPTVERDNQPVIVFVTVCTSNRKPILANSAAMDLLIQAWRQADQWTVGRYVIMPDHIHLFCAPARTDSCDLVTWVRFWKGYVSKRWTDRSQLPLWQTDFWDRQLRTTESYGDKWEYVRNNPVRHGLVKQADDWPFQGELNVLMW
jgi:putative transposase